MRKTELFNENWIFVKEDAGADKAPNMVGEPVALPHTWNAKDGQDGGNDYYRGRCWYVKPFDKPALCAEEELWLEFRGVAMTAEIYLNGKQLGRHEGGYSTFRVNITAVLQDKNTLAVSADNSRNRTVYPQKADFTFYGGIYRDVYLITVPKSHFALGYCGGPGLQATPALNNADVTVTLEARLENTPDGTLVDFAIKGVGSATGTVQDNRVSAILTIPNAHLWNGVYDPYLYTATAEINGGADTIEARFGCREFSFDPKKGFFLNGRSYPLCGAARHQDREGAGSALTPEMHREDMEFFNEMGANTIRLAHYQHDPYFYDLCDEAGMVVWAEIPYISEHMPEGNENTLSQMAELVVQNYNHPSIICWGLSNEITAAGEISQDLIDNHRQLHSLCHSLDITRPTTMAHVFMLPADSELVMLPDIRSYNLYYGWYLGELEDNGKWFDDFNAKYPQAVIGLSEYGADANPRYQSASPERGDYTETYQAEYHEHMLAMWASRPYIWAMHVWNMFDFAADGRDEGGKHGINQKGLVSFDRKIKKDAFYIYKAYLAKSPFVHLCGRRYVDRVEGLTTVKVYSNQPQVTLYVDGKEFATQSGDKVFRFEVPLTGEHVIEARSRECSDTIRVCKANEANPAYMLSGAEIVNWFTKEEMEVREGYYSIKDTMGDIKKSPAGAALLAKLMEKTVAARGDVAQGVKIPEAMQQMLDRTSLEKMLKQANDTIGPEDIVALNEALCQIQKV